MSTDNFTGQDIPDETVQLPGPTPGRRKKHLPTFKGRGGRASPHTYDTVMDHAKKKGGRFFPVMEAKTPMPGFHDDLYKEFSEQKFKSEVNYVEQKLREAVDAAAMAGGELPHMSVTATALHCLESLSRMESPTGEMLGKIFEILVPAIYRDSQTKGEK